jgi:hypothetical protein
VAATSACNAWAVGYYQNGLVDNTLIEHWNGKRWRVQPSPNPPGSLNDLFGVAAVSPTDAWAVGLAFARTLIECWNGKAWKVQRSPNPGGGDAALQGVAALSSRHAWAVGEKNPAKIDYFARTLIERWNGKAWKAQPSPNPAINNGIDILYGVAAVSRTDAWAVGTDRRRGVYRTLIEHWNGKRWKVQPSSSPGGSSNLDGIAAASASSAWAVGRYYNGTADQTLVEHWNGKRWKVQPSPTPSATRNDLYGVAAVSPSDVWAVGQYAPTSGPADLTLIEHWNGTAWTG